MKKNHKEMMDSFGKIERIHPEMVNILNLSHDLIELAGSKLNYWRWN
jgi:hypothetical protein